MNYTKYVSLTTAFILTLPPLDAEDCCDDGNPPSYICEDGSVVCEASDCPPCSADNPNPSSDDKVCCDGQEIALNPIVSYDGDASIWKGDTATWTVSGGCVDDFSVSGTGFSLSGDTISFTAASSSASSSDIKKPTVTYEGSSVSVLSGPVVYEIVDAVFDKETICEGEAAEITVSFSPSGGTPPVLSWSPSPITPAGAIPSGHSLSPGFNGFEATGNERVTASIRVIDVQNWTVVQTAAHPTGSFPTQPYSGVTVPGTQTFPSYTISGNVDYTHGMVPGASLSTDFCGGTISASSIASYSIGFSASPPSFMGLSISGAVTYQSSVTHSVSWTYPDRFTRVTPVYPKRTATMWVTHENGESVSTPYIQGVVTFTCAEIGVNIDQKCCPTI